MSWKPFVLSLPKEVVSAVGNTLDTIDGITTSTWAQNQIQARIPVPYILPLELKTFTADVAQFGISKGMEALLKVLLPWLTAGSINALVYEPFTEFDLLEHSLRKKGYTNPYLDLHPKQGLGSRTAFENNSYRLDMMGFDAWWDRVMVECWDRMDLMRPVYPDNANVTAVCITIAATDVKEVTYKMELLKALFFGYQAMKDPLKLSLKGSFDAEWITTAARNTPLPEEFLTNLLRDRTKPDFVGVPVQGVLSVMWEMEKYIRSLVDTSILSVMNPVAEATYHGYDSNLMSRNQTSALIREAIRFLLMSSHAIGAEVIVENDIGLSTVLKNIKESNLRRSDPVYVVNPGNTSLLRGQRISRREAEDLKPQLLTYRTDPDLYVAGVLLLMNSGPVSDLFNEMMAPRDEEEDLETFENWKKPNVPVVDPPSDPTPPESSKDETEPSEPTVPEPSESDYTKLWGFGHTNLGVPVLGKSYGTFFTSTPGAMSKVEVFGDMAAGDPQVLAPTKNMSFIQNGFQRSDVLSTIDTLNFGADGVGPSDTALTSKGMRTDGLSRYKAESLPAIVLDPSVDPSTEVIGFLCTDSSWVTIGTHGSSTTMLTYTSMGDASYSGTSDYNFILGNNDPLPTVRDGFELNWATPSDEQSAMAVTVGIGTREFVNIPDTYSDYRWASYKTRDIIPTEEYRDYLKVTGNRTHLEEVTSALLPHTISRLEVAGTSIRSTWYETDGKMERQPGNTIFVGGAWAPAMSADRYYIEIEYPFSQYALISRNSDNVVFSNAIGGSGYTHRNFKTANHLQGLQYVTIPVVETADIENAIVKFTVTVPERQLTSRPFVVFRSANLLLVNKYDKALVLERRPSKVWEQVGELHTRLTSEYMIRKAGDFYTVSVGDETVSTTLRFLSPLPSNEYRLGWGLLPGTYPGENNRISLQIKKDEVLSTLNNVDAVPYGMSASSIQSLTSQ